MEEELKVNWTLDPVLEDTKELPPDKPSKRRTVECTEMTLKYQYRRAFSEAALLDACSPSILDLRPGHCYNFITAGDVDSLSYLKVILLHQRLSHCLCSTWCMAAEDILQLFTWHEARKTGSLDIYVGEIFPNQYRIEWQMLMDYYQQHPELGRLCVFRNHSKIFAGTGEKFSFGIQTSANINTNPRTENGCIIIDDGIYHFYKDYFDGIISFEKI